MQRAHEVPNMVQCCVGDETLSQVMPVCLWKHVSYCNGCDMTDDNWSLRVCAGAAVSVGAAGALSEVSVWLPGEETPGVPSLFLRVWSCPAGNPGSGVWLSHHPSNTRDHEIKYLSFFSAVVKLPVNVITCLFCHQTHLLSLFDNVNRVIFDEKIYDQILMFQSQEGESVNLKQPILAQVIGLTEQVFLYLNSIIILIKTNIFHIPV